MGERPRESSCRRQTAGLKGFMPLGASAAATAALTAEALRSIGFPVLMKWPNDIICLSPNGPAKVGGILLEETDGLLTAGIGLNVNWSPEVSALREGAALPPGRLVPRGGAAMDPYELWRAHSPSSARSRPRSAHRFLASARAGSPPLARKRRGGLRALRAL